MATRIRIAAMNVPNFVNLQIGSWGPVLSMHSTATGAPPLRPSILLRHSFANISLR
jgi:hypothetical protein